MKKPKYETTRWKGLPFIDVEEMIKKYRPKEIKRYEENGHMVKVYETRYVR